MKRKASGNRYDGLVEPWKAQLLVSRARRMGFRRQELEDAQQEIILAVLTFRFDPAKSVNESTPLTAMIDNQLKAIRRKARRYAARVTTGDALALEATTPPHEPAASLRLDMLAAMATLSPKELAVCVGLIHGHSIHQIACRLHRGWHTIDRAVVSIRERFASLGLDA